MTDRIPDDVMKAANECTDQFRWWNDTQWAEFVARAIMKERERCAKIAESSDDEDLEINGRTNWHGSAIADKIRKGGAV